MLFFIITQELCFGMCGKTRRIQQRAVADLHGPGAFSPQQLGKQKHRYRICAMIWCGDRSHG
ncbi:MAG: hypothetical protein JGK01_05780 [Microcoleus sp. PH2017_03_ELD_O_A]|uniref:hypothetical protein n=1 Tax=unclassified Microcoleus TaxID=2642155 RepID=UPI001DF69B52|nr:MULTISPECIES: hypothetical protein [unclassified Microcoleus]MCC3441320.1 hypothetical protein [Microcoleus sp. PH2017_03_ELD_O_A]MCC3472642.1 hypothetical protein [Microcoleus sp. PH2017_13_LAR_U_A]MCC3554098.1 hypothetical protein [Microcoleus sp. PH2017_35_SFW_U_B]MCC3565317.1 hypothetical protein [Microcoleus sp. PH2017_31_RDM_U_A]MCC3622805.1 hypothetical protein [Microcoleus sp. PH2017_36_ELK_O_B]